MICTRHCFGQPVSHRPPNVFPMTDDKPIENKMADKDNFSNKGHQMTTPNQAPQQAAGPCGSRT